MTGRPPRLSLDALPSPARAIAGSVTDAVVAAQAGDRDAFEESVRRLLLADPEHVRVVLGSVIRSLLEDLHPDGVAGDDLHALIGRCVRSAATWIPAVDAGVMVVVLGGSLGVHDSSGEHDAPPVASADGAEPAPPADPWNEVPARPTPGDVARHAVLLLAELVTTGGRPLRGYLEAAFTEIALMETIELP